MVSTLDEYCARLEGRLRDLEGDGQLRCLDVPRGIDFCSNDYLGLARHPELRPRLAKRLSDPEIELTAPASRLLRGHTESHKRLEHRLAEFTGHEAALVFPSGYQANVGTLSALLRPEDRVLSDQQNHASLIDGMRLSGAQKVIVPHLDVDAFARELARPHPGGQTYLVTESLFSMDGDIAPLDRYVELVERHNAALIVDDAHATGVYGQARSSGLVEQFGVEDRVLAVVTTFGKALGAAGACVSGSRVLIDYLINHARAFIFSTASLPLQGHVVHVALDLLTEEPWRREQLHRRADRLRQRLRAGGLDCLASQGPIVPVVLGVNERALDVAARVCARGFDVRAIRPPTVAPGTSRLRISAHADHTEAEIDAVSDAVLSAAHGALPATGTGRPLEPPRS